MCVVKGLRGLVTPDVVRLLVLPKEDDGMPRLTVYAAEWR